MVFLVAFVLWERRAAHPLLPLSFYRVRSFVLSNVVSAAMYFGVFGSIFLLSQYLQERRADIVRAALKEFSRRGLHGTTTDTIARAAGVSQPYLFRLYQSKRDIFLAAGRYGFERTQEAFETATTGLRGEAALEAMKEAYDQLAEDRELLMMQMQLYVAASSDEEIRERVVHWWSELWQLCERLTDRFGEVITEFMACGMLVNVMVALHAYEGHHGPDAAAGRGRPRPTAPFRRQPAAPH